jgi:hypothetical protein
LRKNSYSFKRIVENINRCSEKEFVLNLQGF